MSEAKVAWKREVGRVKSNKLIWGGHCGEGELLRRSLGVPLNAASSSSTGRLATLLIYSSRLDLLSSWTFLLPPCVLHPLVMRRQPWQVMEV